MSDWSLPPLREGHPPSDDLVERRASAAGVRDPADPVSDQEIGGRPCLIVGEGPTLLYIHGGGYRMGSPVAYIGYARRIAEAAGMRLVMPTYRLAPEHPFPAGLADVVAVYRALIADGPVAVGGDSAGAALAAALTIVATEAGAGPRALMMISPMLDLEARDATFDSHAASDRIFSRDNVKICADTYLQGAPADAPLVSPIHADPALFPPTLVLVGGDEVLLGDAITFARGLAVAGRRVTLHVAPGMGHVWPLLTPAEAASAEAIAAIGTFFPSQSS